MKPSSQDNEGEYDRHPHPCADHTSGDWLQTFRWYLAIGAAANLIWEVAQLPLYTIWWDQSFKAIAFAVVHCTAGDVVLAGSLVITALAVVGRSDWPAHQFGTVSLLATALGLVATVYLERMNTQVWRNWAYSELMPVIPWLDVGLSPVLQWILLPPLALLGARWAARRGSQR